MTDVWKNHSWDPWRYYKIKIHVISLAGGLPMDPNLIAAWVEARNKAASRERREAIKEAHREHLPELVEEEGERQGVGFARVDGSLAIEGRQIKAMFKEGANVIKKIVPGGKKGKGIAALKKKVSECLFVDAIYVPLIRDGLFIREPDEVIERPIHVMTARGERTSIKRVEVVNDVDLFFPVRILEGSEVTEEVMLAILDYCQVNGLGADRSQGMGRFVVKEVEHIAG